MKDFKNIINSTSKLKLLYVEDNKDARTSVLSILEEFFEDIIVCLDGEEGLRKFKEEKIDLIITDINMPKMSGLEMSRAIREIDKEISILVFSAYNEPKYFVDSIKLGVDGYLLKPIDMEQFLGVISKIIEKYKAIKDRELLKQYKEITDKSAIISIISFNGTISYVNDAFCEISEYSKEELIGKEYHAITNYEQPKAISDDIWKTIREKKEIWQGVIKNVSKNGRPYYLKSTIKPILDYNGDIVEYIALRNDVTAIMHPQQQLNDLLDSIDIPLVVIMKIENFDDIEGFYTQKQIQSIEEKFAEELFNLVPKSFAFEKIFALRNGEYAFAKDRIKCLESDEEIIEDLKFFQQSVNDARIDIGKIDYDISIVISIAYGLNALENAKYGIKSLLETKQDFIVANNFVENNHERAEQNFKTITMIKKAIEDKKIISYFQAIVNNKTKEIEKYESLVRLINEDEKVISPFFFIDISKRGKYYAQITSIVLDNSFAALHRTDKEISINLSILDIEKKQTRRKLFTLLKEYKSSAHRITFELLEDENVKDFDLVKTFIVEVKRLGVQIAIDDFGAGYSNFERLLDYQPDILKIDGSLIKNIETSPFAVSVVKSVVTFAKAENIKVVAEYVENENIYKMLCELGVDYSQGYYFAKPNPLEASQ